MSQELDHGPKLKLVLHLPPTEAEDLRDTLKGEPPQVAFRRLSRSGAKELERGEPEAALPLLDDACLIGRHFFRPDDKRRYTSALIKAETLVRLHHLEAAHECFMEAFDVMSLSKKGLEGMIHCLARAGLCSYQTGRFDNAWEEFTAIRTLAEKAEELPPAEQQGVLQTSVEAGIYQAMTASHLGDNRTALRLIDELMPLIEANPSLARRFQQGLEKARALIDSAS